MLALEYDLDMKRVLSYPLGPVPWALAIATSDGIIDGNALLQAMVAINSEHIWISCRQRV